MNNNGIVRQQEQLAHLCPFCHQKLRVVEFAKRKTLKLCKCGKCGHIIDERILMY